MAHSFHVEECQRQFKHTAGSKPSFNPRTPLNPMLMLVFAPESWSDISPPPIIQFPLLPSPY